MFNYKKIYIYYNYTSSSFPVFLDISSKISSGVKLILLTNALKKKNGQREGNDMSMSRVRSTTILPYWNGLVKVTPSAMFVGQYVTDFVENATSHDTIPTSRCRYQMIAHFFFFATL